MNSEIQIFPPASAWQRIGAKVIDYSLSNLLQCLLLGISALIDATRISSRASLGVLCLVLVPVSTLCYYAYFGANGRMSPGYRVAGIRVEMLDGQPVPLGRNIGRMLLWMLLGIVFCWGGFLDFALILFRKDRRAGHDLAVGTRVVRVGAPKVGIILGTGAFCFVLLTLMARDIIFPLPVRAYFTPSGSMENTLQIGDRMLVSTIAYKLNDPKDGEIAIIKAPRAALLNQDPNLDVDFVKRVVGTPGQIVEMRKAKLFVNGKPIAEPFAFWDADYAYDMKILGSRVYSRDYEGKQAGPWTVNGVLVEQADQDLIQKAMPGKVPTNSYLMLGDHRSNSNDSHVWGFAPRASFRGRAMQIFWPVSHWRSLQ